VTAAAGLVTAVPLLLFGAAALRLPLSLLGFIQYVNPLTQFLLGVLWAHEAMSSSRWAGFSVIWVALALLSVDVLRSSRRRRRDARVGSQPALVVSPGGGAAARGGGGRLDAEEVP
jgi:chloramphenicol-sensitive protein RarD